MGTPRFARIILEALHVSQLFDIVAVYAQPDKPVGRGGRVASPPVAEFARTHGLELRQPEKIRQPDVIEEIRAFAADFIIVAAYGKILPPAVLAAAKIDCINVHASLLPKYRGAAPINHAILNDESNTGVAIMKMVEELDAGPVYGTKVIAIADEDDATTVTDRLATLGGEALVEWLPGIARGEFAPVPQDQAQATYAAKLAKNLAPLSWNMAARTLFNRVRALLPWPVSETTIKGKRLKIYKTALLDEKSRGRPGEIVHISPQGWTVATKDKNILVTEVQLEGKKRMSAFDVSNGLRVGVGVILGT